MINYEEGFSYGKLKTFWACVMAGWASGRANGNANDVHFDSQANPQSYSSARTAV